MNSKMLAIVFALAVSGSGLAVGSVRTGADVRGILTSQGYLTVSNIQQDGDTWTAEATAPKTRQLVKVRIDAATGIVAPDDETAEKSPLDILQAIQAAGYTNVSAVRFIGGVWKANAVSSTGHSVSLKLNPADGRVIEEKPH
jgi:hypothetical protein